MYKNKKVHIEIDTDTIQRLKTLGTKGSTYNQIINDLIDYYEKEEE